MFSQGATVPLYGIQVLELSTQQSAVTSNKGDYTVYLLITLCSASEIQNMPEYG